jgi:hypothetical protein
MSTPRVSVIVPVPHPDLRLDAERARLDACLEAVREQRYPPERLEVLLVGFEGGGALPRPGVSWPGLRVHAVDRASPYAARNLGASRADGDILVFTEVRCVPDRDWVAAHVRRFSESDVSVSVGAIAPGRPTRLFELFSAYEATRDAWLFSSESWHHFFGRPKNMAITRERFEAHGPFIEVARGGDSSFVQRVARDLSCDEIGLTPDAIVRDQALTGFPSCLADRFAHNHAMQIHDSAHVAPIDLPQRVRFFRETIRRQGLGPLGAASLFLLIGAGVLAFRLGGLAGGLAARSGRIR